MNCNSQKKTEVNTNSNKPNSDFIGIYEYKTPEASENHYIMLDIQNGKYTGVYYGTEDKAEHDVLFYANELKNLTIKKGKISFDVRTRNLYKTTQMRIVKQQSDVKKDSISDVSKGLLKYSGILLKNEFTLNCASEFGHCWADELNFKKVTE